MRRIKLILISFILLISCKDEEPVGTCCPHGEISDGMEVKKGLTKSQCLAKNNDDDDGVDWVFAEGDIPCPPDLPE